MRTLSIALLLGLAGMAMAQEQKTQPPAPTITVQEAVIATGVEKRLPVGVASQFSPEMGQLVCWTKLTSLEAPTEIEHVWYFNEKEAGRMKLSVGAKTWRTWSRKTIAKTWIGSWRVDVVDLHGNVLKSVSFSTQNAPDHPKL
ncbi:MAG: DUF2914 domain-containing protein [Elusimicrobiota bacterium]